MKKIVRFAKGFYNIYIKSNLTGASAALSYYLTMTFFPLIICLYTMLGNSYDKAIRVLHFLESLFSAETVAVAEDFLGYVARNHSSAMMVAGLTLLITSSSAAFRALQITIGEMQGKQRFEGFAFFLGSIVFSLVFVAAMYFGIVVMFTGREFIMLINRFLPFIDIGASWNTLRFILFGGIEFLMIFVLYSVCMPSKAKYSVWEGALLSTAATVGVSVVFSVFIGASTRYPLVYGSIASIILLMFWLYMTCMVIYCGAAVNITLRDIKNPS